VHVTEAVDEAIGAFRAAAEVLEFVVFDADLSRLQAQETVIAELAHAMHFPRDYGKNWDAVLDDMRDLSWDLASGYLLLLREPDTLLLERHEEFKTLLNVTAQAGADWRSWGTPFHVLLAMARDHVGRVLDMP
jgi:hypothetical protein